MGVLDIMRGEIQSRKTLNDKEQKIFDVLIKCSGVYCYGEEMRSKSKVYLPYVSLWDLALERHTILYELISQYRKCVSEYGIDVCRYEREYNLKKINVEHCYNKNWDSSLGLNDEVCKGNKIAKDIKNDIEWLSLGPLFIFYAVTVESVPVPGSVGVGVGAVCLILN